MFDDSDHGNLSDAIRPATEKIYDLRKRVDDAIREAAADAYREGFRSAVIHMVCGLESAEKARLFGIAPNQAPETWDDWCKWNVKDAPGFEDLHRFCEAYVDTELTNLTPGKVDLY